MSDFCGFSADPTGVADSYAAITAALLVSDVVDIPTGTYRITDTIIIGGGKRLNCNKVVFLKDFDGVGVIFNGDSNYATIEGDLEVRGYGSYAATGLAASTSPTAHGIVIDGSRVRIHGALRGNNHQGDGVHFTATGNANKCRLTDLWAGGNAGHGVRYSGTQDDAAVWRLGIYAQGNYLSGVTTDDDFSGRHWEGFIYAEANAHDGTSDQVHLGKLRSSALWIYAERSTGTGMEIVVDEDCTDLDIFDARANLTSIHPTATTTCRTYTGGRQRAWGVQTSHGTLKLTDVNNNAAKWSDFHYVTSEGEWAYDRVRGDRTMLRCVYDPSTLIGSTLSQSPTGTARSVFGGEAYHSTTRFNGTTETPTTLVNGDVLSRETVIAGLANLVTKLVASHRAQMTYASATKAAIDYIWATTPNGASAPVDTFKIGEDGNITILQDGKGIRLMQPNGTARLVTLDNSGNLVIT